jgi:hypothetical protein
MKIPAELFESTLVAMREEATKITVDTAAAKVSGTTPMSQAEKDIVKLVKEKKGSFGCLSETVLRLFAVAMKVSPANMIKAFGGDDGFRIPKNTMVVITTHSNGNDYPLNQPYLVVDEKEAYLISSSGKKGNHAPFNGHADKTARAPGWRFAAPAEINTFFEKAAKNSVTLLTIASHMADSLVAPKAAAKS